MTSRARPSHLQRPEGYFVEHGRIEELDIGVLEDESYAPSKRNRKVVVAKAFGRESIAAEADDPVRREAESVEQAQQGRFSGAICAYQRDRLSAIDGQRKSAERGNAARTRS